MWAGGGYYGYQGSAPSGYISNSFPSYPSGGAPDGGQPGNGIYGKGPPGEGPPSGGPPCADGRFASGRPQSTWTSGATWPMKAWMTLRSWRTTGISRPQEVRTGGPGDLNITFNTTGLETSLSDSSGSVSHLLGAQQVTNQHLHQQMQLNNTMQ